MGGPHAIAGWPRLALIKPWLHSCQAYSNSYPKCSQERGFPDWRGRRGAADSDLVTVTAFCFVFWFSFKVLGWKAGKLPLRGSPAPVLSDLPQLLRGWERGR